jgi:sec-independent protein translocase protein TatB
MMKRMSFSETIFLFFLALIIFGPKKMPEIARQVGKWMNEFRRASNEFKAQIEQEIANLEVEERKKTILPPSPPPEGTASRTLNAAPSEPSPTVSNSAVSSVAQTDSAEAQAALAASEDEPLFATAAARPSAVATETPPANEAVAASTSQESHA